VAGSAGIEAVATVDAAVFAGEVVLTDAFAIDVHFGVRYAHITVAGERSVTVATDWVTLLSPVGAV